MVDPKVTYDYGTGVLRFDLEHEISGVYLTGEQFDSVVKQLVEICTAEVADYNLGYDVGYAEAESEASDHYDDRYDDGYDDGYDEGYSVGYTEAEAQWEDDEDDE